MRTPKGKKYFSSEFKLFQYQNEIKFVSCRHCGKVGFLICHGYLRGYSEVGDKYVVRGCRFFCSNRFRKKGCGQTFSVFRDDVLRGFVVRTRTLWAYILAVLLDGMSRKAAWERFAKDFTLSNGYRIWRRVLNSQIHIRALLLRERPPPNSFSKEPMTQLLEHFRSVFPFADCPFSSFQNHFQTALLQ